jgi:Fe2+ or Zn2+ uptake regulation protein
MTSNNKYDYEAELKAAKRAEIERLWFSQEATNKELLEAYKALNIFKEGSYVQHVEQDIQGKVIYSDASITTIYDADCPNDDDFEEESYGPGSALTFKNHELKLIEKPN